jgi:hypothetical protein
LTPPNVPPIEIQTKTPSCSEDRRDCIQELSDWADQYRGELEKQSSARAAQIESLLTAGDYEAIREWIDQWLAEDSSRSSLLNRYREVRSQFREARQRQRQRQLYGSVIDRITGKASTDSLTGSGAGSLPTTDFPIAGT